MAYTCQLVYSNAYQAGTVIGTVNLNDSTNIVLNNYTPLSNSYDVDTVEDTMRLEIKGTSQAMMGTTLHNLERVLRFAKTYHDNHDGPQVFLQYQPTGYSTTYRTELLQGNFDYEDPIMSNWDRNYVLFGNLKFERRNFWEVAAGGLVGNNYRPTYGSAPYNYCTIGTSYTGSDDLPAPAELIFGNSGTSPIQYYYVFQNSQPAGTFCYDRGTAAVTVTNVATATTIGTITNDHVTGKYSRLCYELGFNGTIFATPIVIQNGATISYSKYTIANSGTATKKFFDFGLVKTPPIPAQSGTVSYQVGLILQNSATATISTYVYHQWIIESDSYVKIEFLGNYLSTGQTLIYNPYVPNIAYIYSADSSIPTGWVTVQGQVNIEPKVNNNIYPITVYSDGQIYDSSTANNLYYWGLGTRRLKL